MGLAIKKTKVYLKIGIGATVLILVLLIILMNRNNKADIWLFRGYEDVNVLWLSLVVAVSAVVIWWGTLKIASVVRELREVKRMNQVAAERQSQERIAQQLSDRERKIDEKLRQAISQEQASQKQEPKNG